MGQFLDRWRRSSSRKSNAKQRQERNRLGGFEQVEHRRMLTGTELVFDVNVIPDSVHYQGGVELDGAFYFYAESQEHGLSTGFNLWKYDPAANDGQGDAEPLSRELVANSYDFNRDIIAFDGKVFISVSSGGEGSELWSYDPATNQFTQVSNIYEGYGSASPAQFTILNDRLYFLATDNTRERAIVEYDPHANNGAGGVTTLGYLANDDPRWMEPLGNRLYFTYDDEVSGIGEELWYFEVNVGGGSGHFGLVADINEGQYDSNIKGVIAWNEKLYFGAYDGTTGQLREYDPHANDGQGVLRSVPGAPEGGSLGAVGDFAVLDGQLYFGGYDPVTHWELWRFDPVTDSAEIVFDVVIGGTGLQPEKLTAVGGKLYFSGFTQSRTVALFSYDPAANDGLVSIDQVNITGGFNSYAIPITTFDGKVVFVDVYSGALGSSIWGPAFFDPEANDGAGEFIFLPNTWNDTQSSDPTHMLELNGKYYFQAYGYLSYTQLWEFDPAATPGADSVRSVTGDTVRGIKGPQVLDGKIYFAAYDVMHGEELWVFDPGANDGEGEVSLVADIGPGYGGSNPRDLTELDGKLYFNARHPSSYEELFVFDPLANGGEGEVRLAADIRAGGGSDPKRLTSFQGKLFLNAYDGVTGAEVWIYDPAANEGIGAAFPLNDLNPGWYSSDPREFTPFNGKLYFTADDDTHGYELWEYDPLASGDPLRLVADIDRNRDDGKPTGLQVFNGKLYFTANNGVTGEELWVFDPASNTVSQVADVAPGSADFSPDKKLVFDDKLYMVGSGPDGDQQLWVYDPAAEEGVGSLTQVDLNYAEGHLYELEELWAFGDKIYLTAFDINYGRELFIFDPNNYPFAADDAYAAVEDTPLTIDAAAGILSNDTELGDGPLVVSVITNASHGVLVLNNDGSFTYTPHSNFNGTDTFVYEVRDLDGDFATGTVQLTIQSQNDPAQIGGDTSGTTHEDTLDDVTGTLTISDIDAGEASFLSQVNSAGMYGTFSLDANGNWAYSLSSSSVQYLTIGSSVSETFVAESTDGTQQIITIQIEGRSDVATLGGVTTGSVMEDTTLTASGTATIVDPDQGESAYRAQTNTAGTYGTFSLAANGQWSYSLDLVATQSLYEGQEVTDTFAIESLDGGSSQLVAITITGVNDAAVIGGDINGTTDEDTVEIVRGTLTISDIDQGESEFQSQSETAGVYGSFTVDANGNWAYTLDTSRTQGLTSGSLVSDTFLVESLDGTQQAVVIGINGLNDIPVMSGEFLGEVREDGAMMASGVISITDVDQGESVILASSRTTTYGSFSIDFGGNWTYSLDNHAVQFLAAGQTQTDTYTILSLDGSLSRKIVITITGDNDAAVFGGDTSGTTDEDTPDGASGVLTVIDPDQGESSFIAQTDTAGDHGTFSLATNGSWVYTLDTSGVQNLPVGSSVSETFLVESTDGTQQAVTIEIEGRNDAPAVSILSIDGYRYAGNELTVVAAASDIDTGSSSFLYEYQVYYDGSDLPQFTGSGQDLASFPFEPDAAGEYRVVVTVSDSQGETASAETTITIGEGSNVEYQLVSDLSFDVGDIDNNGPGNPDTLHEWEDATGELWLTIDVDLPAGLLDFRFDLRYTGTLWLEPQLGEHLGEAAWETTTAGEGLTSMLTLTGLELSEYAVGDRVLLATIIYPKDVDDAVGLPMDQEGAYPQPLTEHGIQLESAGIAGPGLALTVDTTVPGQVAPVVYDANDDGRVGLSDFASFISNYGKQPGTSQADAYRFDYNQDGRVGVADFALFISHYGRRKSLPGVSINLPPAITAAPPATSSWVLEGEPGVISQPERTYRDMIVLEMFGEEGSTQAASDSNAASADDFDLPEITVPVDQQSLEMQLLDAAVSEIAWADETPEDEELASEMVLPLDWSW